MRKSIKYAITYGVGAVIALIVCLNSNIFQSENTLNTVKILSDAFFTSGVLLGCFGLLCFAANEGTFDMLSYSLKMLTAAFRRKEDRKLEKNLFEYKMAKKEPKKIGHLIVAGVSYLILSGILVIVFYQLM